MSHPPSQGFTIIELMVCMAIAAILIATAVPSFSTSAARARLEGSVNELAIDLQYARSEAIRRRSNATLAIDSTGTSYTLAYRNVATGGDVIFKTVNLPQAVSLTPSATVQFTSLRGIAAAQTINATSNMTASALRVLTNATGRVQTCSPGGSFSGYAAC